MSEVIREKSFGERKVAEILNALPTRDYYWEAEPEIIDRHGQIFKPDFVVVIRKLGVAVIEVKDWISIVDADPRDKTITIEKRDGSRDVKRDPLDIARNYAYALEDCFNKREELRHKHNGVMKLKFPWQTFVILPNIDSNTIGALEEGQMWEPGAVLGQHQVSTPDQFEKSLNTKVWRFSLKKPLDKNTIEVMRGVLQPSRIVLDNEGRDIGTVTPQQEKIITEPIRNLQPRTKMLFEDDNLLSEEAKQVARDSSIRLIRGVAGSGKSLVLVRRVKHLSEMYPELKLAVVTFNRDLSDDLAKRINSPNVVVTNFHKLCRQILVEKNQWHSPGEITGWINRFMADEIRNHGLTPKFVSEEISWRKDLGIFDNDEYLSIDRKGRGTALSSSRREIINQIYDKYAAFQHMRQSQNSNWMDWEDVPYILTKLLQNSEQIAQTYDVILIDEAQDFAPSWFHVIKLLLKPGGTLFLCDDPTQSLFRNFSWKEKGIDVVGRTRILRVPFRNTKEINIAAHSLISADSILSRSEEITQPNFDSLELVSGPLPILVKCSSIQDERKFIEDKVIEFLNEGISAKNIAILCHDRRLVRNWEALRSKGIYLQSFRKMKGLEFQVVFIPSLHCVLDSKFIEEDTLDENVISGKRRAVFTAMTRAKHHLIMSYQHNLPDELSPIVPCMEQINL